MNPPDRSEVACIDPFSAVPVVVACSMAEKHSEVGNRTLVILTVRKGIMSLHVLNAIINPVPSPAFFLLSVELAARHCAGQPGNQFREKHQKQQKQPNDADEGRSPLCHCEQGRSFWSDAEDDKQIHAYRRRA